MTLKIVLAILYTAIYSRGIFEIIASKTFGYAINLMSLFALVAIVLARSFWANRTLLFVPGPKFWFLILYFVFAFFSMLATTLANGPIFLGLLYTGLHGFFLMSIYLIPINSSIPFSALSLPLISAAILVTVTGFLEFFGIIHFPGSWELDGFSRIAGSLGSKQHFSFASAALGMLVFWLYLESRKIEYLLLSLLLILLTFISLSRNGLPIIVGTFAIYYLSDIKKLLQQIWKPILFVSVVLLAAVAVLPPELYTLSSQRFFSIVSSADQSNIARFAAWQSGLNVIANGHLLFGTQTGLYSQAGDRLGLADSMHFESALLQQFANYGIIGGLAFVLFFVSFILSIRDAYLRGLATMFALMFIYYPGSEVLPIVGAWIFLSLCAATKMPKLKRAGNFNLVESSKGMGTQPSLPPGFGQESG